MNSEQLIRKLKMMLPEDRVEDIKKWAAEKAQQSIGNKTYEEHLEWCLRRALAEKPMPFDDPYVELKIELDMMPPGLKQAGITAAEAARGMRMNPDPCGALPLSPRPMLGASIST